ncbi:porin [Arcicella rosea]|uniref:Phosphate-selective porin n=1 Tax=Arcicella rosea TaxID=502909 RepID=A0A841EJ06_9BACT|nr:porin [Arcicella rosea]MBB6002194.1 phosphate-selective porin [Arcicella rosea]
MKTFKGLFVLVTLCVVSSQTIAQNPINEPKKEAQAPKKWYDKISLRGYAQVRYNRLLETNEKLKCEQCDRSWGENGGFFIRRGRLIFSGDISDRLYIYVQPDFASNVSNSFQHSFQIRDAYFDLALDAKKESRLRIGQSKVPYGFENMQSSQNRLALDRADPTNSPVSNERDLGIFFYWAKAEIRKRFAYLVSSGLKGSGDYGVFAFGLYNGQNANKAEQNNEPHVVSRITYPFQLKSGQIIETGIQAYTGKFVIEKNTKNKAAESSFIDRRVAATLVVYPQPFGFQAEYNVGEGPEFNPSTMTTEVKKLNGGYAQVMYRQKIRENHITPFIKYQYYNGGKKHEIDARRYIVKDLEIGAEWQLKDYFELTAIYTISDRTFEDVALPVNRQTGNLLRLQAQFNF